MIPNVQVTWRPNLHRLHYEELYRGLPEYVRAAPVLAMRADAVNYLRALRPGKLWVHNPLQMDRIAWVRRWIAALPLYYYYDDVDDDDISDAETVDASSASPPPFFT
jgi:hypothetical protein